MICYPDILNVYSVSGMVLAAADFEIIFGDLTSRGLISRHTFNLRLEDYVT